jgi:hypothetical protein
MYPEATALKSTRPPGRGDFIQTSKGHTNSGIAVNPVSPGLEKTWGNHRNLSAINEAPVKQVLRAITT